MTQPTDERVVRLYGLPLEEFTPARNALAAELRAAGERELAAEVKALRKPSAAAWAVNQLVRAEPDLVETLLGAGGELRQAHRQAASGRGAAQLRAAAEAERAAVELLMARSAAAIGRSLTPALADAIRNSLHAASSDDEARERVRSGTLTTELRPVGLGPMPGGGGAAPVTRATGRSPRRPAPAAAALEVKRRAEEDARLRKAAAAEAAALQRELDAATRALDRAEDTYARAREAAEAAAERVKDARKRMREARGALAAAKRRQAQLERDA